jgi:hypothetical protein
LKSTLKILVLLSGFCLLTGIVSVAQPTVIGSFDVGDNNAAESYYIKSNAIGQYRFGKNMAEAGFLMNLKNTGENFFPGYRLMASRDFAIREFPFAVRAFLVQTTDADMLRETNWGLDISKEWKHIDLVLGTYFKIYAYRNEAIETYGIEEDAAKMKENFNFLYSFTYRLKKTGNPWNIGLTVTNFDYFLYNQETNPLFNLNGTYKLNESIELFAQAWFETSGIFNINATWFGYYFRTGIKWNIK